MTRFAHCNRIFARSRHCSSAVSRALLCVLIAASSVQHAEAVLVGLAPRCQDATATRNIPHVESTTEAVYWVNVEASFGQQIALTSVTFHGACAFLSSSSYLFISFVCFPPFCRVWERFASDSSFTGRHVWRYTEDNFWLKFRFLRLRTQTLVGRWRPPSGF